VEGIDWRQRIVADAEIVSGKPSIKGTRLSVEHLLGLFAVGWTAEQVLRSYPQLSNEDLSAVFAYAADCVGDQRMFTLNADVA
jgi:uncharacterized protein (DUF433 family)